MDTVPLNALSTTSLPSHETSPMPIPLDREWALLPPAHVIDIKVSPPCPPPVDLGFALAMAAKRLVDVTGAAAGLALLAPVMAVIAVLIRLGTPGPALFRQRRLGRGGQPFWIIKFRTMRVDAEQHLAELEAHNEAARGVLFKMRDDPRVTVLGRFLRRTNLDELPQLWNVLRGEMSLVGPRPFQMRDSERLRALNPLGFRRRLEFPPGLTGAWQVGRTDPTDSQHLLELDLDYIDRWSLGRDLRIIYRTVFVLLAGFRDRNR
jgi:lipopolysaccharide/colanic/teichoic acid biosynthesis glycosyltransferase